MIVAHVRTIPRSYRDSIENSWKSVILRNVNRFNPNQLRLEQLISLEYDLTVIHNLSGDMDKVDPYVRRKMAQRLDPSIGADWRELARRLGLGTLESAFAIHSSPTTQVLAQYEVISVCSVMYG